MKKSILETGGYRFTRIYTDSHGISNKVVIENLNQHSDLDTLLSEFTYFLKGCGFTVEGELSFYNEDSEES